MLGWRKLACVHVKALHNDRLRQQDAAAILPRQSPGNRSPPPSLLGSVHRKRLRCCRYAAVIVSSRLCSRNRPLPSIDEASSDADCQFKFRLIQETPHVTKFSVRDRTRLARFSVVNCGTGRQYKRASQPGANRDLLRISDLNTERSVIDSHLDERQRDGLCGTGKGFSPSGASDLLLVSPASPPPMASLAPALADGKSAVTETVTAAVTYDWQTVAAAGTTGTTYVYSTPTPNISAIGSEASGNQGVVIGGPVSNSYTWWQVAFDDDLTGLGHSGWSCARVTKCADPHVQRVSSERRPRRLVDAYMVVDQRDFLQRNRLLSIRRLRICLGLADREHHVQHHLHRQRRIYGSISGGDREPSAQLHLESVAPGHFQQSGDRSIRRHGDARPRLHGRKFVRGDRRLDGSSARECLRPSAPKSCGSILRPSSWVEDQNFIPAVTNKSGNKDYQRHHSAASFRLLKNRTRPVDSMIDLRPG